MKIIKKYYRPGSPAYNALLQHSKAVTHKALEIAKKAKHLKPDYKFIKEASMLHDIGIFLTDEPEIGCYGKKRYLYHGLLGRKILEKEGLPKHALVCERHVGVGITAKDIEKNKLALPKRDMVPVSIEEGIICLADKFFSKSKKFSKKEKTLSQIIEDLSVYGKDKVKKFNELLKKFNYT